MDCVYICRPGNNEELKYSIRSIVQNMPHRDIWVVGYKPEWYVGNFISVQNTTTKFENIRLALKTAAEDHRISDDFILMNDDFFVINPVQKVIPLHGGLLIDKINRYRDILGPNRYVSILENTYKFLIKNKIDNPLDYDIHTPMPMNKNNLLKIINRKHFPRSLYGNMFKIGGDLIDDVKIYPKDNPMWKEIDIKSSYLSAQDDSFDIIYNEKLKQMFNKPSKYEHP